MPSDIDQTKQQHVALPTPKPTTPEEPKWKIVLKALHTWVNARLRAGAEPPKPEHDHPSLGSEPTGPQSHVQRPGDPPPTDEPKVPMPAPVAPGTSG